MTPASQSILDELISEIEAEINESKASATSTLIRDIWKATTYALDKIPYILGIGVAVILFLLVATSDIESLQASNSDFLAIIFKIFPLWVAVTCIILAWVGYNRYVDLVNEPYEQYKASVDHVKDIVEISESLLIRHNLLEMPEVHNVKDID